MVISESAHVVPVTPSPSNSADVDFCSAHIFSIYLVPGPEPGAADGKEKAEMRVCCIYSLISVESNTVYYEDNIMRESMNICLPIHLFVFCPFIHPSTHPCIHPPFFSLLLKLVSRIRLIICLKRLKVMVSSSSKINRCLQCRLK